MSIDKNCQTSLKSNIRIKTRAHLHSIIFEIPKSITKNCVKTITKIVMYFIQEKKDKNTT